MQYLYSYYEMNTYSEDIGNYFTYGIRLTHNDSEVIVDIKDVSSDLSLISDIVKLLNEYQASPENVREIISDLIS